MDVPPASAGCVAFACAHSEIKERCTSCNFESDYKFVMVKSKGGSGDKWTFAKGGIKRKKDQGKPEVAATRELFEEAGVKGFIVEEIGVVEDILFFLVHVTEVFDEYPENGKRQRRWITLDEIKQLNIQGRITKTANNVIMNLIHDRG